MVLALCWRRAEAESEGMRTPRTPRPEGSTPKPSIVMTAEEAKRRQQRAEANLAKIAAAEEEKGKRVRTDEDIHTAVEEWCNDPVAAMERYGEIGTWDVSAVTDMSQLFERRESFNDDISSWDTANVTSMWRMFFKATKFNQPLGAWDTDKVQNMCEMFRGATAFNQPVEGWRTSNVLSMRAMFRGASAFNQKVESWDTSNVTDMNSMFFDALAFDQSIDGWDTSKVGTNKIYIRGSSRQNTPTRTSEPEVAAPALEMPTAEIQPRD